MCIETIGEIIPFLNEEKVYGVSSNSRLSSKDNISE